MDYAEYLKLTELLKLQQPRSPGPAHDELLFIVIHQVYELWFRVAVHEAELLRGALTAGDATTALLALKRMVAVQRVLNGQVEVLETMTPAGFAAFRDYLGTASGFQSVQFRELEILLGERDRERDRDRLAHHAEGSDNRRRLERRLAEPSVYTALLRFLAAEGHAVPDEVIAASVSGPPGGSPAVRLALLGILRGPVCPALLLCEALADLDEGFQHWRYLHVKLVERFIGTRTGTGGSSGAEYLRGTLFRPLFPDLWTVRSEI
jgi:tryptophan 2,3-dioxygenase